MIKPFFKKQRRQSGDTIIEVLIVLAILGLGLSISYATANGGLSRSRNAQEHSEALGIINSQIEMLRSALAKKVTIPDDPNTYFCMWSDSGTPLTVVGFGSYRVPSDPKFDTAIGKTSGVNIYPTRCVGDYYHTSVVYVDQGAGKGFYDIRTRWDAAGSLGRQQEELTYKVNQTAVDLGLGIHTPPPYSPSPTLSTPSINIRVQKIQSADGRTTPTCTSGSSRVPISGVEVSLNTGHRGTTDGTGKATILELVEGQSYTASYSNSSYGSCNGGRVNAIATPNNPRIDTILVTSQCTHTNAVYSNPQPYDHYDYNVPVLHDPNLVYLGARGFITGSNPAPYEFWYGQHFFQLWNPSSYLGAYGFYREWENQPYYTYETVYLGYYADPPVLITPASDTCT